MGIFIRLKLLVPSSCQRTVQGRSRKETGKEEAFLASVPWTHRTFPRDSRVLSRRAPGRAPSATRGPHSGDIYRSGWHVGLEDKGLWSGCL